MNAKPQTVQQRGEAAQFAEASRAINKPTKKSGGTHITKERTLNSRFAIKADASRKILASKPGRKK